MKIYYWIILGLTIAATTWFIYRTRVPEPRVDERIDLNWRFNPGDTPGAETVGFDDSGWDYVSVPHDWMIRQKVDSVNSSGRAGGFYPGGIAWYRRNLDLSGHTHKSHFTLLFEGVYMNADVWFNGTHLGRHVYGYSSFHHDVSRLVRRDTLNVIAVRTDCSTLPVDRWYSGAGIYRPVRLIAKGHVHIPVWSGVVTSRLDSAGNARLSVSVDVRNSGSREQRYEIRYDVVDPGGRIVADGKSTGFLEAGTGERTEETFEIADPLLWSPGSPSLYSVNCYLMDRSRKLDHLEVRHGIRTARFDPDRGFLLNGEKVLLKGVNLHHDGGALGSAVPKEVWERRFEKLKKLGVNAIRLAHNPHAPEVLDLCDEMGFLVIDEMYDKWEIPWPGANAGIGFQEHWRTDLAGFVRRDRNHASVILWSVGNETLEQLQDPGRGEQIYREMAELVRTVDPTRQVTCGLHPGYADRGNEIPSRMMEVTPVVAYNYRSDSFNVWHERYPDKVFIASETKVYGFHKPDDYQVLDFSNTAWHHMEPHVAGMFIWAGIDYLGESPGWPQRGFDKGLMETTGEIKPYAWYYGSLFREDPMVRLAVKDSLLAEALNRSESWQASWAGPPLVDHWTFNPDSAIKEVVVFTNCERIELELNGRRVASLVRNDFRDGVIRTRIPYLPGTLVSRAFYTDKEGNEKVVRDSLVTADRPYALAMNPDRETLGPRQGRLVHITTRVVDSTGVLNPHSRHLVNYRLDGPGRIRAIDNGDLSDHAAPDSASREVRRGKQLLILQAGSEPGDLIIRASADGLRPSEVKIKNR